MIQYNIDFFEFYMTSEIKSVHHDVVYDIYVDDDYLSLSNTTINIGLTNNVEKNQIIYISGAYEFVGIVVEVSNASYMTSVTFAPLISIFKRPVLVDVKKQAEYSTSQSLEDFLMKYIKDFWINTNDNLQNVKTLRPFVTSSTGSWSFGIKPDEEEGQYAIVDFYESILSKALSKHGVAIIPTLNFNDMRVDLSIGRTAIADIMYISTDDPDVFINTFTINGSSTTVNKLIVYNTQNYSESITYFLHNDDDHTYGTGNYNRIQPVILELRAATPNIGEEVAPEDVITFAQAAKDTADEVFGGIQWNNLIELDVDINNNHINPKDLKIGQEVYIYRDLKNDGNVYGYRSMLTGKRVSDRVELIFGTIRLDFTTKIKSGGY